MSERASVFEVSNIGLENANTPGIEAREYKRLKGTSFAPSPKAEFNKFRARGFKYSTKNVLGKEWAEAGIEGVGCFDDTAYLLSGLFGDATIQLNTPSTGANTWTWTPKGDAPDTPRTFSVMAGSSVRAMRFTNGLVTGLEQVFNRDSIDVTGLLLGKRVTDGVSLPTTNTAEVQTLTTTGTPTGGTFTLGVTVNGVVQTTAGIVFNAAASAIQTALEALTSVGDAGVDITVAGGPLPTAVTITFKTTGALRGSNVELIPNSAGLTGGTLPKAVIVETTPGFYLTKNSLVDIQPDMINVYMDSTFANIGLTQLTRDLQASWSITGKYGPIWTLDRSQTSWAAPVELAPDHEVKLTLAANAAGMALLDTMRLGQQKYVRIEAVGDPITGAPTVPYSLVHDFALEVTDIGEISDSDGLSTIEWTFGLVDSTTLGGSSRHILITDLTAL
jgi:hypothetical protein